jgi:hypothetical protein
VLILPQLLHGLAATALLLARLEGEGMHNHVSSLGTNDITKRLYMWDGLFSLRTHENGRRLSFVTMTSRIFTPCMVVSVWVVSDCALCAHK